MKTNFVPVKTRNGFGRADLIVITGVVIVLVVIAVVGIRYKRDQSRINTCRNRLRSIAIAAHDFHDIAERLPPGTLGSSTVIDKNKMEKSLGDYQFTSSLGLTLRYHDIEKPIDDVGRALFSFQTELSAIVVRNTKKPKYRWVGDVEGIDQILDLGRFASRYRCPDDHVQHDASFDVTIITHPVFVDSKQTQFEMYTAKWNDPKIEELILDSNLTQTEPSLTNYLGCGGAHEGGRSTNNERSRYDGVMSTRGKISLEMVSIQDGVSQTIMYGESIGEINNSLRDSMQSLLLGGLARGTGLVEWGEKPSTEKPLFGDVRRSSVYGFGSAHSEVVNFAFADTGVKSLSRSIDFEIFRQFCARNDGKKLEQE